jgi:hypothetical protein
VLDLDCDAPPHLSLNEPESLHDQAFGSTRLVQNHRGHPQREDDRHQSAYEQALRPSCYSIGARRDRINTMHCLPLSFYFFALALVFEQPAVFQFVRAGIFFHKSLRWPTLLTAKQHRAPHDTGHQSISAGSGAPG